ncbi:MAG: biotin/lipoyl-binding protein [Rhodospirillales bacterium]|nr:MAG: biotin/lipoyl-binding protein [Rhodospirillales bacterium]TVR99906.1 MAG: biotin/lipoyl-binding protein [Rhodospirillales bacterium]
MTKHLKITVEGKVYDVIVEDVSEDAHSTFYQMPSSPMPAGPAARPQAAPAAAPAAAAPAAAAGANDKVAPIGGVIVEVSVKEGAQVKAGDKLAVIEAMKMKTIVGADHDGTVQNIRVREGDAVEAGQVLMTIA